MTRRLVVLLVALLLLGSSGMVVAQDEAGDDDENDGADVDDGSGDDDAAIGRVGDLYQREPVQYQITFPRLHAIIVPAFVLDGFFDMHPNHWSQGQTNWAFGGEFIIRRVEEFDLIFSADWADIRTTDDWWMESDETLIDADWGENGLGLFTIDVAINWFQKVQPWWDIYYGLGLGIGVIIGDFAKTDVDPMCIIDGDGDPFVDTDPEIIRANCIDESGNPRLNPESAPELEDRVPPIIPALSFNLGSRFIIDDQWAIQLEAGFKNIYFYGGLELGFIFE